MDGGVSGAHTRNLLTFKERLDTELGKIKVEEGAGVDEKIKKVFLSIDKEGKICVEEKGVLTGLKAQASKYLGIGKNYDIGAVAKVLKDEIAGSVDELGNRPIDLRKVQELADKIKPLFNKVIEENRAELKIYTDAHDELSAERGGVLKARANEKDGILVQLVQTVDKFQGVQAVYEDKKNSLYQLFRDNSGKEDIIIEALKKIHNYDFNSKDRSGETLLCLACQNGHIKVVEFLLKNGADVNIPNDYGSQDTPLHVASEWGFVNVVRILLENNAEVDKRNISGNGDTPLHLALRKGDEEVIKLLIEHANVNARSSSGDYPIYIAVSNDMDKEIIQRLLDRGADVNLRQKKVGDKTSYARARDSGDISQSTLYDLAKKSERGDRNEVAELIKAKLYDNLKKLFRDENNSEDTLIAAINNIPTSFDLRCVDWKELLALACKNGHVEVVKLLIGLGVDVNDNVFIDSKFMPIIDFVGDKNKDAIIALIENRQKLNEMAIEFRAILVKKNKRGDDVLGEVRDIYNRAVKIPGFGFNFKDPVSKYFFMFACLHGSEAVVNFLISCGANVNDCDRDEKTPLHHACSFGNTAAIKALIEEGADLEARDAEGFTPLYLAFNNNQKVEVILALIDEGADVSAKVNINGVSKSMLEVAEEKNGDRKYDAIVAIIRKKLQEKELGQIT